MATNGKGVSRREALWAALGTGAVAAAPLIVPASALGRGGAVAPSDRVTVGGLGIGSRGAHDLKSFLSLADVQFVAVCDVRNERRETIKAMVDKKYDNRDCAMYADQQELWARKDIDALLIATGDRWHTLLSVMSAKAGKDVYCEKPCSMTIADSRALADTFLGLGRIYQAGTQRRNGPNFIKAFELARSGKLGKLKTLHAEVGPGDRWAPATIHDWLRGEREPAKQVVRLGPLAGSGSVAALPLAIRRRAAGGGTSISMAAAFWSGARTRWIYASGRPARTTLRRWSSYRRAWGGIRRTRSIAGMPTVSSWRCATAASWGWAVATFDMRAMRAGWRRRTAGRSRFRRIYGRKICRAAPATRLPITCVILWIA